MPGFLPRARKTIVINRFKPEVSLKTRMFMAALLWSCIGLMLIWRGGNFVIDGGRGWLLPVSILFGFIKSWAVLDRVAVKNLARLLDKGEFSCLGGVYSWKTWLLVAFMIALGRLLRASPLQAWLVGCIYVTVGWSLFWSSRKAWLRLREISGRSFSELTSDHKNGDR